MQGDLLLTGTLLPVLVQGGRTFVDTVGRGVDFVPGARRNLERVDVILLLGDVLDAAEQEQVPLVDDHRVASSCLCYDRGTYGGFFC